MAGVALPRSGKLGRSSAPPPGRSRPGREAPPAARQWCCPAPDGATSAQSRPAAPAQTAAPPAPDAEPSAARSGSPAHRRAADPDPMSAGPLARSCARSRPYLRSVASRKSSSRSGIQVGRKDQCGIHKGGLLRQAHRLRPVQRRARAHLSRLRQVVHGRLDGLAPDRQPLREDSRQRRWLPRCRTLPQYRKPDLRAQRAMLRTR